MALPKVMLIDLLNYLPKEIIPKQGAIKILEFYSEKNKLILKSKHCKKIIINRYLNLSEKDLIAFGLYLAEGQKFVNLERKIHHTGEISISYSDLEGLELFCQLLEKIGIERNSLKIQIDFNINLKNKISKEGLINYWLNSLNLFKKSLRPNFRVRYTSKIGQKIRTCTGKYGCLNISFASTIFRSFFLNFINKLFLDFLNNKNKDFLIS